MGWKDEDGDVLFARLYWQEDGASNESIYRFYYNGVQLGTASSSNLALAAGDVFRFTYNGSQLRLIRTRNGVDATLYSLNWSDAEFQGNGRIYMEMTLEGAGGEITLDNLIAQTFL